MRLTDDQITKYQQIYLKTFGESLSQEDALVQGMALLRLVKVLSSLRNNNIKGKDHEK